MRRRIRDVIQAPDGPVWLLTDAKDGEPLRLTPSPRSNSLRGGWENSGGTKEGKHRLA